MKISPCAPANARATRPQRLAGQGGGYSTRGRPALHPVDLGSANTAIVGLPLAETAQLLQAAGVTVWRVSRHVRALRRPDPIHVAGRKPPRAADGYGQLADLLDRPGGRHRAMLRPRSTAAPGPTGPMKGRAAVTVTMGEGKGISFKQAKGISPGDRLLCRSPAPPSRARPHPSPPVSCSRVATPSSPPRRPASTSRAKIRDEAERDRPAGDRPMPRMEGAPEGHGPDPAQAPPRRSTRTRGGRHRRECATLPPPSWPTPAGPPEGLVDAPDAHHLAWRDWGRPRSRRGESTPPAASSPWQ